MLHAPHPVCWMQSNSEKGKMPLMAHIGVLDSRVGTAKAVRSSNQISRGKSSAIPSAAHTEIPACPVKARYDTISRDLRDSQMALACRYGAGAWPDRGGESVNKIGIIAKPRPD